MPAFRRILLLVFFVAFLWEAAVAQTTIQGSVKDANTGKPLTGVNVYLAQTTIGQSTDQYGNYELTFSSTSSYYLVFSHIGYAEKIYRINQTSSSSITVNVEMEPKIEEMKEIRVVETNKKWKRQFNFFFDQFIGQTEYADQTTIENPWILDFAEEDNHLIATAQRPLEVINNALGYKLHVELVEFKWPNNKNRGGFYKIYSRYQPLTPESDQQAQQWIENRLESYLGSFNHFLTSLYDNNLKQDNFAIKDSYDLVSLSKAETKYSRLLEVSDISPAKRERLKGFKLHERIEVVYQGTTQYQHNGIINTLTIEKHAAVKANKSEKTFFVDRDGSLLDPISLRVYGIWGDNRLANSLPTNYRMNN